MPEFSTTSWRRLAMAHPDLQAICHEVIKHFDFKVISTYRGERLQNYYFRNGYSRVRYPGSKHNVNPSLAIDLAPWPIDYDDHRRFYILHGYMMAVSALMGIRIVGGADWDGDGDLGDQSFHDLGHYHLVR